MSKVTKAKAQASLAAIKTAFNAYLGEGGEGPVLMEDFDGRDYTIVWEDGAPYDWPFLATGGGVDEELAGLAAEFGTTIAPMEPVKFPDGVFVEPVNHLSVGLYPK